MTLFISIIFILSGNLLIFDVPTSHGQKQGYHISTISQVLTPQERFMYLAFNTLPNRIYYSAEKGCYVVRGQPGYYKNDLRRKNENQYKSIPRWQYYMNELSPGSLIKSGLNMVSIGKNLLFGGDGSYYDDYGDDNDDVDGRAKDDDANKDISNNTDGAVNQDKRIDKEPGLISKGLDMGKNMMTPLFYFFGGPKDSSNNNDGKNNDEKKNNTEGAIQEGSKPKDDKQEDDKPEGSKPEESESYTGMVGNLGSDAVEIAKEAMQNDVAKEAVKAGISMFIPGGPAIVAAMDAASKYQKADDAIDKVGDKLHI